MFVLKVNTYEEEVLLKEMLELQRINMLYNVGQIWVVLVHLCDIQQKSGLLLQ